MRNSRESGLKKEIVKEIDNMEDKEKQDGAASESSSSREGIVRKFSCQDIRH